MKRRYLSETEYDFSRLTEKQKELLTFQGWYVGSMISQPRKKTVEKLIARGLLVERETKYGAVRVTEYEVPISVHMAWCAQCEGESDEE